MFGATTGIVGAAAATFVAGGLLVAWVDVDHTRSVGDIAMMLFRFEMGGGYAVLVASVLTLPIGAAVGACAGAALGRDIPSAVGLIVACWLGAVSTSAFTALAMMIVPHSVVARELLQFGVAPGVVGGLVAWMTTRHLRPTAPSRSVPS